jgi:hypothetical protein
LKPTSAEGHPPTTIVTFSDPPPEAVSFFEQPGRTAQSRTAAKIKLFFIFIPSSKK